MKKTAVWSLCIVLTTLTLLGAKSLSFSGQHQEWNDLIDEVAFVQDGPWGGRYEVLIVEPLEMSETVVQGQKKALQAAEDARKLMPDWCRPALDEGMGAMALRVIEGGDALPAEEDSAVILRWRCEEIDPGSRAKRYWVGFGAGKSGTTLAGTLVDRATGKDLMTFRHRKESGIGVAGGDYMKFLRDDASETAKDIGAMIGTVLTTPAAADPE